MNPFEWLRRHSRLLAALVALLWFAPVGFVALAALLVMSPPLRVGTAIFTVVTGGLSLAWINQTGVLPDQILRAGIVIAVAVFLPITFFTRTSLGHRVILAASAAAVCVTLLLAASGRTLHEMQWWVEHRLGHSMRLLTTALMSGDGTSVDRIQMTDFTTRFVRFTADYNPAIVALQIMAGLALASTIYYRLAARPRGVPPGRFRDFNFTDHLGWAAIGMLVVVLVPQLAAAKLGAMNVLLVLGSLFAIRGAAVAIVAFLAFGGGWLNAVLLMALAFLLLPLALIGAILLGIVDTRFDLRKRWESPVPGG